MPTIFRDPVLVDSFEFNNRTRVDGAMFNVDTLDGWDDSPEPTIVVGQFTYSDGVVAAERFPFKEKYMEVGGWVHTHSRQEAERAKTRIRAMFDPNREIFLVRQGPIPQGYRVRASTKVEFPTDIGREGFRFLVQVMADWPFRLGVEEKDFSARPFTGAGFYRLYEYGTPIGRKRRYQYNDETDTYYRTYYQSIEGQGGDVVGTVYRTNYAYDPRGTNTDRWGYVSGTGGASSSILRTDLTPPIDDVSTGVEFVVTTAKTAGNSGGYYQSKVGELTGTTDSLVTVSLYAYPSSTRSVVITGQLREGSSPVTSVNGGSVTLPALEWTRVSVTMVATGNYDGFRLELTESGSEIPAEDSSIILTGALAEKVDFLDDYFNGDYDGTPSIQYIWEGAIDNSPSQLIQYTKIPEVNPLPDTITIVNEGNAHAYPIMEITGPLSVGSWYIQNDTTGEILTFDSAINDNQVLVVNNLDQTAVIDGVPVDYYIRGTWIRLAPGLNQIRLVSGADAPGAQLRIRAYDTWS